MSECCMTREESNTQVMKLQAQELIEQAYQRGYKAGYDKAFATLNENWQLVTSEAEEKGRNEAWEAAKKILIPPCDGGLATVELKKIFGESGAYIFNNFTVSEAIEKIRAYEKKKKKKQEEDEEIKVGDVIRNYDVETVVTWCNGKDWNGFLLKGEGVGEVGQVYSCMSCNYWKKTGRTFPEIAEALKKLQEEGE